MSAKDMQYVETEKDEMGHPPIITDGNPVMGYSEEEKRKEEIKEKRRANMR